MLLGIKIVMACLRDFRKKPRERHGLKKKAKWEIMLAGRCSSSSAVMPEGPGDLCFLVVMGGKEGSRCRC